MEKNCSYIPPHYWEWLSSFRFDPEKIQLYQSGGILRINVTDYLYKATLYEVPILAIVSQVYSSSQSGGYTIAAAEDKLIREKISLSNREQIPFSEFGTRRRYSAAVQDMVCDNLSQHATYCTGTSNCYFALKYGMKMMGTHPHEWFMFHGAMYGPKEANHIALENWVKVYDGDLGIALADTYTTDVFLSNFSKKLAKLFDGVRQDSGDPYMFVNKVIDRYKELGIDPTSKTIVFSDALTMDKANDIKRYCDGRIKSSFGIGTNLTNDMGLKHANIVMKLDSCAMNENQEFWEYCVKLSDVDGKHTGKEKTVRTYKEFLCI